MTKDFVCKECGATTIPKLTIPGSIGIELLFFFLGCLLAYRFHWGFIIAGLGYTVWRNANKFKACASCGSKSIIPENTPIGRDMSGRK